MRASKRIPKMVATNSKYANGATDFESQIKHLRTLNSLKLRQAWQATLGSAPPPIKSPTVLLSILAWELQAREIGGIDARVDLQLRKLAAALCEPSSLLKQCRPGDRLSRVWKGVMYEVEVCDLGYKFENTLFRSLSAIARRITGTRWSGPRFFGV